MAGWVGAVGMFIGFHDDVRDGKPAKKCQIFELRPFKGNPDEAFVLRRGFVIFEKTPEKMRLILEGPGASTVLARPDDRDECILDIAVGKHGLIQAMWNGKPCPELSTNEVNKSFERAEYLGAFGTFNRRSQSVFGNARLLLFDKETQ